MARYDVAARFDAEHVYRTRVSARTAVDAHDQAHDRMLLMGFDPELAYYATVRRRGLRRRTDSFAHLPPDGPDPAGVREPRRPVAPPPELHRGLDQPT